MSKLPRIMKTKIVKRYYCDHCKKGGQSSYCIRRHETTCIRNPLRVCPVCSDQHVSGALLPTKETCATLVAAFRSGGLPALRIKANECPACMLSGIVQALGNRKPDEDDWVDFDYKKEMAGWNTGTLPQLCF